MCDIRLCVNIICVSVWRVGVGVFGFNCRLYWYIFIVYMDAHLHIDICTYVFASILCSHLLFT